MFLRICAGVFFISIKSINQVYYFSSTLQARFHKKKIIIIIFINLFIYLFFIREITRCRILALGGLQSVHDRIHRPFPYRNICYIISFIIVIVTIIIIISSSSSSSICGSFICLQPQCDPIHCVSSSQIYEY